MNGLKEIKTRLLSLRQFLSLEHLVLILVIVAGLIIRIYFSYVYPLWNDEAITANAAIALKNTGIPAFPSGFEYWRSIPYTFAVAVSASVLGNSELALRAPSLLFSGLTILFTYKLADRMYSSSVGLIASSILSFSLWHTAWSTQVRAYIMFQLLYLAVILFMYKFEEEKNIKYLFMLGLLTLLASYTHKTGYMIPFIFLAYLTFSYIVSRQFRKIIGFYLIATLSIAVFFLVTPSSISDLMAQLSFQEINPGLYYKLLFSKLPLLLLFSIAGVMLGIRDNLSATFLLSISIFPAAIVYIFFVDGITSRYLFFSLPILSIWSALSIKELSDKFSNLISKDTINVRKMMVLLTILFLAFGAYYNSVDDFRPETPDKAIYSHLENKAYQNDTVITQWTPVMTYYYRPPDYSLYGDEESMFLYIRKDHNIGGKELYAGAEFINDSKGLKEAVNKNSRGWLVLRDRSYEHKRPEVKAVISKLISIGDYENYMMWKWNGSISSID